MTKRITTVNVWRAVERYQREYSAPASVSDVQFLLTIPAGSALDKAIDKKLKRAPASLVIPRLRSLHKAGLVTTTPFGGYRVVKRMMR
jgi:hypothetical protein